MHHVPHSPRLMAPAYNHLEINGWRLEFRFRDDNRVKVSSVTCDGEDHPWMGNSPPFDLDDCNGDEFARLVTELYTKP
jgi:hypothetical protein